MLAAEYDLVAHLLDHPWEGWQVHVFGMRVTLMSAGIISIFIAAAVVMAVILPTARRRRPVPSGLTNVLEVLVLFVRDRIARPALHERAEQHLSFLLTLFVFVLALNLIGLMPLTAIGEIPGMEGKPVGVTPTTIPAVCATLAGISLLAIFGAGLRTAAVRFRARSRRPMWVCLALSPALWVRSLAPSVPGITGKIMALPMALLELAGAVMKCFALMIRLLANMVAGHALLAVMMMFILQALSAWLSQQSVSVFYVAPFAIAASVAVDILELLVAGLQAYIFTFLSAMFLSLYVEPSH